MMPPPMGRPGMPPMMGQSPMGPSPGAMAALKDLQQVPVGKRIEEALEDVSLKLGQALADAHLQSARAAKLLADALSRVEQAREALAENATAALPSPPDMGGGMPGGGNPPSMGPF